MVACVALATPVSAQAVKISGGLVTNGDVSSNFAFSPDGRYAVFIADKDTDNKNELYSVRLSTGVIANISGGVVTGGNISSFQISPDSARVVFRGDLQTDEAFELYSAPIAGGSRVSLSGTPVLNGGVDTLGGGFQISPDSARVVFRGDLQTDNVFELYSAPIGGGSRVSLSGSVVAGGDVAFGGFQISPDSARVVFRGDLQTDEVFEVYSAPIGGGTRVSLSGTPVLNGGAGSFRISQDGARVLFLADKDTFTVFELYRVQIGGKALVLDFDNDDRVLAHTDLMMLLRHLNGVTGSALVSNALSQTASISSPTEIRDRILAALALEREVGLPPQFRKWLDIDLNGTVDPATDGVMLLRYLLGFRGGAISQGALGPGAALSSPELIELRIKSVVGYDL